MTENTESSGIVRFIFPDANILIVDDILTNLKVIEGLLSDYKLNINTCSSGKRSIDLIKKIEYDIIFMDHLMPEMDGIKTVALIRAWEEEQKTNNRKRIPIIALTANAAAGMREMFIKNGFDDFISKPIDISRMEEILENWLSNKKIVMTLKEDVEVKKETFTMKISGIDTEKGISRTGGKIKNYIFALKMFYKDAKKRAQFFQKLPDENKMSLFTINVHALKSAAVFIGAEDISKKALDLETAGRAFDFTFIENNLGSFARDLAELLVNIHKANELCKEADTK
ncbi:MAG: response regulator [Treponema sp.]|nr:response regulator [Treponema sp.]